MRTVATPGPSSRLLEGFRALAADWFADEPKKVQTEIHGGRFDGDELMRFASKAPAVRAGCLAVASAQDDGLGGVKLDLRLAAVAVAARYGEKGAGEDARGHGAHARRLADRLAFELARDQAWAQACFSAAELDPARPDGPRGRDIGDPREIRAANLYSGQVDKQGIALWAVTWTQQFRAIASDFALPLPAGPGIPDTVLSGRAPEIGSGHEGDYEQIVPQEAL